MIGKMLRLFQDSALDARTTKKSNTTLPNARLVDRPGVGEAREVIFLLSGDWSFSLEKEIKLKKNKN
jgi:hypothetical protein